MALELGSRLSRLCSIMQFPEHFMIFPDTVHMLVWKAYAEHFSGFKAQNLFLHEGSFKKGLGQWSCSVGPGPRAHMGLGISVPYNFILYIC